MSSMSAAVKNAIEHEDCRGFEVNGDVVTVEWDYDNSRPAVEGLALVKKYHYGERATFTFPIDADWD